MVHKATKVRLIDNSGAYLAKIIQLWGGNKKTLAYLGNLAVVTLKKIKRKQKKVKKGQVFKFRLLRRKEKTTRKDGSYLQFHHAGGILLNSHLVPFASRIKGPLPRELKKKYSRICSLAKKLI